MKKRTRQTMNRFCMRAIAFVIVFAMALSAAASMPMDVFAANNDFVIEDGVLTEYKGSGGEVVIPDGVTCIGGEAFYGCTNLKSVTIPNSVEDIDYYAFYECTNLQSVKMSNSITSIGQGAFIRCKSLKSISLPDSLTYLDSYAFSGCSGLTTIKIPKSLTEIGGPAFVECTSLTQFTVDSGNKAYCAKDGILYTKDMKILMSCPSKKSGTVAVPNSVAEVHAGAFNCCKELTSITLPNSVVEIGDGAFSGCTRLVSLIIPKFVTVIYTETFNGCSSLTTIIIPNSVTTLVEGAFSECTGLKKIVIPNFVTEIGNYCFWSCSSLESITIPKSVTEIGWDVFLECEKLRDIYYTGSKKQWNNMLTDEDGDTIDLGLNDTVTIHFNSTGPEDDSSSVKVSFPETEYSCKVGESIPITAIITASELPKNISWKCNDDNIISFSGTSNVGPTVTGKENTWWVSVEITASSNVGDYEISMYSAGKFLASVKLVVYTDIFTGELQAVDEGNKQITIDGKKYTTNPAVDYTSLKGIVKGKDSKKVVYQLSEGKIVKICSIFDVLTPRMTIKSTPDSFVYSNGEYNKDSLTITLEVMCFRSQESPFSFEEVNSLDGLSLTLKEFTLYTESEYLYFGIKGTIFKKEIKEEISSGVEISYSHVQSYQYTVYVSKDRIPTKVNNQAEIRGKAVLGYKEKEVNCNSVYVSIGNLDLQKKQNNQNNLTYNQKLNATKQLINKVTNGTGETTICLDAYILDYITPEQQKEIEEFLTLYVACAMNAEAIKDETSPLYKNVLRKVCNFAKDKVCDRILDKIKMKKNPFLWTNTLESSIDISGMSKQGKKITITFDIKIESYTSGSKSSDPYAAMCWINYKVRNSNDIPAGAHRSGTGAITWVNMQNFAETMMDFLEVAYDQSWGQHLDDFAEGFVSSSMRKFIKGEFSGNLYKLSTSPIKSSTKKVIIDCPVDVYVYDRNGNECGAIINNAVLSEYNDVFLTVNGDSKIIYLTDDAYSVRIVATDSGTMDYIVEEYEDSNLVRKMTTIDVPLKKTSSFNAFVPDVSFVGGSVFRLHEEDGSAIELTSDTYQPESYTPEEAYEIKSGKCGKNAIWKLYSDGLLIISGSGDTYNYDNNSHSPFYNNDFSSVDHLVVEDGITSIGDYLFFSDNKTANNPKGLINLQKIELANSVSSIGVRAFYNCTEIDKIFISTGLQTIGKEAFRYCDALESIFYFGSESNLNRVRQMFNISSNSEKPHIIIVGSTSVDLPGDLNNDGKVNGKDATRLMQYLAGWDVEIDQSAADVNGDGKINGKDATRLMQYLAGWDVTLGK